MPPHRVLVFVVLLAAGAPGCRRQAPSTPPASAGANPTASDGAATEGDTDACTDWSKLDRASLEPLPETPYTATLEHVWETLRTKHWDTTLACLDWPAIRQQYGERLTEAEDVTAAYRIMGEMLGELGTSHLGMVPPHEQTEGEPRSGTVGGSAIVPISVRVVGDEAIVVDDARHGFRSGIPRGAVLVGVEDHEIAPLIEKQRKNHPKEVDWRFRVRREVSSWLTCPPGAKRKIRYRDAKGKENQRQVACKEPKLERITFGNLENVPVEVEHRMIAGSTVGYLRFNIWLLPMMEKIDAALTEMRDKGMTALIIDLRGNPGGVGAMVVPLARRLLSEPADLGTMRLRDSEQTFKVTPGEDPFTGPIALLVDEGTGSTSEIFAQGLVDLKRAKVFGASSSQGAALPSVIEELPDGGTLQYVVADFQSPAGVAIEGRGVLPDVTVPETAQDFANGRDPVLDAAIEALGSS